jgi:RimJ/RimL family protein N-acetyltransferase
MSRRRLEMLKGKLVLFRALEEKDLPELRDWRNSDHVKRTTREYRLLNMFNQKSWFEALHKNSPPHDIMFGIMNKKQILIGVCGLTYINWKNRNSEISIYLDRQNWQTTKEATDAMRLLMRYAFDELGLHKTYAEIYSFVGETIQLYESLGFHKDGVIRHNVWRSGKWWDSYIYSMLDSEFRDVKN